MNVDVTLTCDLSEMAAASVAAEESGYQGIWTFEGSHDPFLPLLLAAEHTREVTLGTSIAVAFARNPMLLATMGWDLQSYSGGRFVLGLGSQIKPHITRRYSMPWSRPAARMADMIDAVRSIWDTWLTGGWLDYRGEFYQHTLMTPLFMPDPNVVAETGTPPIWLAGIGEHMTRTAGAVADGFLSHPLATADFIREVTIPTLNVGAASRHRDTNVDIHHSAMIIVGATSEERAAAREAIRKQISFYASTPAYWPILELHGRASIGPQLRELSKQGKWIEMADLIDDELVDTVAVTVNDPASGAMELSERFGGLVDRLGFNTPYQADAQILAELAAAVR
ncbi:putative oxidoreductase [Gordonia effusa NBRC 100432]|uniref:Putative oxidoreductase n=1 Tax=Gordonia effusa NBRC 100432 TaxID=1077974 RepID=H0QY64_9ACTN|nr:TIGR03617 family F420-dependent LLM class oxidoreductase [Gordonia effusa]GAB17765.1 putative oxidoreductase [Gordonia effusa NBRC 100432]